MKLPKPSWTASISWFVSAAAVHVHATAGQPVWLTYSCISCAARLNKPVCLGVIPCTRRFELRMHRLKLGHSATPVRIQPFVPAPASKPEGFATQQTT